LLEWQTTRHLCCNASPLIVINLALSFAIANISIGGHIGGLIGGLLATLAFSPWGRGAAAHGKVRGAGGRAHAPYGKLGVAGVLGLVLVAVASIAIAYWQVRGLA